LAMLAVAVGGFAIAACGDDSDQDGGSTAGQAGQAADKGGSGGSSTGGGGDARDGDAKGGGASDGSDDGGDRSAEGPPADEAPGGDSPEDDPATPEGEARTTVTNVYGALTGGSELDAAGLCDLMTPRAQRQTTRYAEVSSGIAKDWNCELAVEQLVDRTKRTGGFKQVRKVKVIGVNVEGDRATATIRFGDGPATSLPLTRHDGEWKLDSSPSGGG
jgi:hypothetical protein